MTHNSYTYTRYNTIVAFAPKLYPSKTFAVLKVPEVAHVLHLHNEQMGLQVNLTLNGK